MIKEHGEQVSFLVVYIREAHAVDGTWPLDIEGQPEVKEHKKLSDRKAVAETCLGKLELEEVPAVVDEMDDEVNKDYSAWPDRLVLVDAKGRLAWRSGRGPKGFKPDELDAAIRRELAVPADKPAAK